MSATYVPAVLTTASELELLRGMRDGYAILVGEPPKRGALASLTAQVALETGRLKWCRNWNLVNEKGTHLELYTAYKCNEQFADGWHWYLPESEVKGGYNGPRIGPQFAVPPAHPQCRFVANSGLPVGVARHLGLLRRRYGKAWGAFQAGQPAQACRYLKEGHFFTADLEPYARAVVSLTIGYEKAIDQNDILLEEPQTAPVAEECDSERSCMTNYDLEERVSALVVDGMARLNQDFWLGEFQRSRDAAQERKP